MKNSRPLEMRRYIDERLAYLTLAALETLYTGNHHGRDGVVVATDVKPEQFERAAKVAWRIYNKDATTGEPVAV